MVVSPYSVHAHEALKSLLLNIYGISIKNGYFLIMYRTQQMEVIQQTPF